MASILTTIHARRSYQVESHLHASAHIPNISIFIVFGSEKVKSGDMENI